MFIGFSISRACAGREEATEIFAGRKDDGGIPDQGGNHMGEGVLKAAASIPADLVQTLYGGQKAMTDQALQMIKVNMEAQAALKQQETALQAVSMMTGIGGNVNTVV
jgi:hypothetical protein